MTFQVCVMLLALPLHGRPLFLPAVVLICCCVSCVKHLPQFGNSPNWFARVEAIKLSDCLSDCECVQHTVASPPAYLQFSTK